jgi:hypothetical protein
MMMMMMMMMMTIMMMTMMTIMMMMMMWGGRVVSLHSMLRVEHAQEPIRVVIGECLEWCYSDHPELLVLCHSNC